MKMYEASVFVESAEAAPAGYVIKSIDHSKRNTALTHEVFGYFPYWFRSRWAQLDYRLVSTIAYFSGEVNADGSVGNTHGWPKYSGDPSAAADVVNMINTAHANGVKVVLCFTNFTTADLDAIVGTPLYRTTFIQQALAIVQAGNGDGVNIDFEGINSGSKNALTQFMHALADSFHTRLPGSQVSCAPTDYDTRAGDWDLAALYNAVDLFFFQGYGYGWSGSSTALPVGLLPNTSFWGSLNITTLINFVLARMPADKALLGVPHYGRRWPTVSGELKAATQGTGTAFYYPDALGYIATYGRLWEQSALNAWFRYQSGTQWYQGWYDDPQSMSYKYQFVLDRNLRGVGMWALGMDAGNHDIWDVLAQYFGGVSGIAEILSAPDRMILYQNFPNPFNPSTTLEYSLPQSGFVSLKVFDLIGREVAVLVNEEKRAGTHRVVFRAASLSTGTYFGVLRLVRAGMSGS
jgi:spore germination protein YaaH